MGWLFLGAGVLTGCVAAGDTFPSRIKKAGRFLLNCSPFICKAYVTFPEEFILTIHMLAAY